jgi:phosphatidylserine decarboxylase
MEHLNDIYKSIKNGLTPVHPEGFKFAIIAVIAGFILGWLVWDELFVVGIVLGVYCLYFFRDPERVVPQDPTYVVSPADGLVQKIVEAVPPAELNMGASPLTRISIFLNVFDVHINRVPMGGTITAHHYVKGRFLNAELDKASDDNERQLLTVENDKGQKVGFIQIAGFVARRIICNVELRQPVKTGERFGLIRFGSRVDVYLPEKSKLRVLEGQRAIGGETVLATLP